MSTATLDRDATRRDAAPGRTPRVELDVAAALGAVSTAGLQLVPDIRGGTVLDGCHRAVVALLPHLPTANRWLWDGGRTLSTPYGDLPVRTADEAGGTAGAVLVDLEPGSEPQVPGAVVGFHLDLTAVPPDLVGEYVDVMGDALRAWQASGRRAAPLVVPRGARTMVARKVVGATLRACRGIGIAPPTMRVDATPMVLDIAVSTVLGMLSVEVRGGGRVLEVDGLPRSTAAPLRVLGAAGPPARPVDVLLRHHGRLVPTRVTGGSVRVGSELAFPGWIPTQHRLVVRGFPEAG